MIKRYDFTEHGHYDDELYHTMDESEHGEYVRYADVEHLLAKPPEVERAKIIEDCARAAEQWTAYDDGQNILRRQVAQDCAFYIRRLMRHEPQSSEDK